MADRGKVIRALKQHLLAPDDDECVGCPYFELEPHECERQLYADAVELLKAQEPMKPRMHDGGGKSPTWWYVCGACGNAIDPKDKFCRECGRKVKWDAKID